MVTSKSKSVPTTRERLLDAAARVFAESGLEGATTREIARQAKVNEVTLFRHFQSKEKLLGAVLERTFNRQEEMAPGDPAPTLLERSRHTPSESLRADLQRFARRYDELLQRNFLLVRTLLGEIHRHRDHESSVLHGIFAPLKADLIVAIKTAHERGALRSEIVPIIAADMFSGMIFIGVLRRSLPFKTEYAAETYIDAVVDLFARGIEP